MASEPNTLKLHVVTPEKEVLRETVSGVQLPGLAGYLGILPGHAPLLTELGIGELTFTQDGAKSFAVVSGGFAEVLPDRVTVLAEIAELAEDVDVAAARAARDSARKRLAGHDPETDWAAEAAALKLAEARLAAAAEAGVSAAAAPPGTPE